MNNMRSLIKLRDALVESIETNPSVPSAETQFIQRLKASDRMINTRFERMQRIIRLLNAQHGVVLAAGSGNGLNAALSVLAGASEVYAVEINPARYEVAADLFARLGLSQRIHLVTEDILAVKLPENSIDGIYSLEFLEHINDSLTFYCLCYSWLRPGGRIYGRTGANGANILKRQLVYRKVWNRIDAEYACERRRMIAEAAPDLPAEMVERCVAATRGLHGDDILDVVACCQRTGEIRPCCLTVPRQPRTGEYMERPRHPRQLIAEMRQAGLQARTLRPNFETLTVRHPVRRLAIRCAGAAIAAIHPLSLPLQPWLEVLGIKPGMN